MSGTPVIRFAKEQFVGLEIQSIEGILNGTSNFVLGRMEEGLDLDAAVAEAQALGYAEADPTADIGGSDVQLKVTILANELLGGKLDITQVECRGITDLTLRDIATAEQQSQRWKLVGSAVKNADGTVTGRVEPKSLDSNHPLHGISGATNAVTFHTDMLGAVTVSGPGAGRIETVFALISDIVAIDKASRNNPRIGKASAS
jgi:homoserine dehydrogenase